MGVIKRGILGGFSKKIANVVGTSWKGIAVIKSLPLSVANPNTAKQQTERGKFKAVGQFASAILTGVVKPMFDRFAQSMSGYNQFIKLNISHFGSSVIPTSPGSVLISNGKIAPQPIDNYNIMDNSGMVRAQADWTELESGNALPTDEAYFVVQDMTTGQLWGGATGEARSDEESNVLTDIPYDAGHTYHLWVGFRRADGTQVDVSTNGTAVDIT